MTNSSQLLYHVNANKLLVCDTPRCVATKLICYKMQEPHDVVDHFYKKH